MKIEENNNDGDDEKCSWMERNNLVGSNYFRHLKFQRLIFLLTTYN